MKWMEWIASWFGGTTKSQGSLGVGLRAALSGSSPGGWASDHREETAHNTGFNYIAIHAIAAQVAGATVTVFADGDQQTLRRSRRKSLASRVGSFAQWKSTYGADDRETDPLPTSHPLVRLLRRPNPYESGADFRYRQAQQMRLTGTCLIWNVPSVSGPTCERYVIPTSMATPVAPTPQMPRGGWRINPVASRYTPVVDGGFVECPSWYLILGQIVDARQVQVIRLPHAWYLDDGQSPLSAGAKWVDAAEAVDEARFHQLKNGIDPSVVWNLPPDVSPDQDEIDRVQAKISAKYGGPENVGRVMVAQSGTSVTPLTTTPRDMCYSEGFHDFKAAVLALHQTPPVAVGLQEPGAYAAYNASMKAWRHAAIQPLCDMLAEADTEHLAPQFGEGLTVEIESATVDDTQLLEQQLQNDLAARVRTKNEWRAVRGMPPLPGTQGDELVGTDNSSETQHPQPQAVDSSGVTGTDPVGNEQTAAKSSRPQSVPPDNQSSHESKSSNGVLEDISSPEHERSRPNPSSDTQPISGSHVDDNNDRVVLIAEIVYGLFGDAARSNFNADSAKAEFNPNLHPRDERGRFTVSGSSEPVVQARQLISGILRGDTVARSDERIVPALNALTTPELESIHREHGVSIPNSSRDRLVESVHVRLLKEPSDDPHATAIDLPATMRATGVEVFLQHSDEVNRRVGRQLSPEEWGQLVGAQSGARVHVFPAGRSRVEIAVKHPDYSGRRIIFPREIENTEFEVVHDRRGKGLGVRVFTQQVEKAAKLGFELIRAHAIGDGEKLGLGRETKDRANGYYTWARLGFDGPIPPLMNARKASGNKDLIATVQDFESKYSGVKNVSEMMLTKSRRDWWKKYGGEFHGVFDLGPNSPSRRVLARYLKEKEKENRKSHQTNVKAIDAAATVDGKTHPMASVPDQGRLSDAVSSTARSSAAIGSRGEVPDQLSEEDEQILERIWDEIGRENGIVESPVDPETTK